MVIGCDGLRSRVRELILPRAPSPAPLDMIDVGGYASWPQAPLPHATNVMVFGERAFFGAFLADDERVWWFHNASMREDTSLEAIARAHEHDPPWIAEILARTSHVLGPWPTHDICSMPVWHEGAVVVIGDAAHATSPSAGQGASLALEDALVLARCLRDQDDVPSALLALERARRQRVERIVTYSRRMSTRKVSQHAVATWWRDRLLPFFLKMGASMQREIYDHHIHYAPSAQEAP